MSDKETTKIEELTVEQSDKLNEFYHTYLDIGFSNEPLDRSVTREIDIFYDKMDTPRPTYIWAKNPIHANIVANALKTTDTLGTELCNELEAAIDNDDYITTELVEKLKKKVKYSYESFMDGSMDAYWVGYCKFGEFIGVEYEQKDSELLEIWDRLIKKCGFWYCYEGICIVCDRPICKKDDDGELHCEDGPALYFNEDSANILRIYCIHGVEVPEKVVMSPETLTIKDIEDSDNAEVKRITMERLGIGKYLDDINAKIIQMDMTFASECRDSGDTHIPRILMEDNEGRRFLVGTDGSTHRIYHMQVPNTINTCSEAHSALIGFDESKIVATS